MFRVDVVIKDVIEKRELINYLSSDLAPFFKVIQALRHPWC